MLNVQCLVPYAVLAARMLKFSLVSGLVLQFEDQLLLAECRSALSSAKRLSFS